MSFVFLSFFVVLYWLLQLGQVKFIEIFAPFFESIKNFAHLFYQRSVTLDTATIDFSFLIMTFVFLIAAWLLNFVIEATEKIEKKYDFIHAVIKQKAEELFNFKLEKEHVINEYQNNKFFILINFTAANIEKDKFFHRSTNEEPTTKRQQVLLDFLLNLDKDISNDAILFSGGILLTFNKFNEIDQSIEYINKYMADFRLKYKELQIKIDFLVGVDVYAHRKEIKNKVEVLKMVLNLNANNKILCLSSFKQRYSLMEKPQFEVDSLGIYKLKEGEEEIFCIKN